MRTSATTGRSVSFLSEARLTPNLFSCHQSSCLRRLVWFVFLVVYSVAIGWFRPAQPQIGHPRPQPENHHAQRQGIRFGNIGRDCRRKADEVHGIAGGAPFVLNSNEPLIRRLGTMRAEQRKYASVAIRCAPRKIAGRLPHQLFAEIEGCAVRTPKETVVKRVEIGLSECSISGTGPRDGHRKCLNQRVPRKCPTESHSRDFAAKSSPT